MKKLFTKRRVVWGVVGLVVLLIIVQYFRAKNAPNTSIEVGTVQKQDLQQTVLATGQVTSGVDLSLSFLGSGVVKQILVKEGDIVKEGQLLATLDQSSARASLLSAQGALAQAQANYDKVLQGAKSEQVTVSQRQVDSAAQALATAQAGYDSVKKQQDTSVQNAYRTMLNGGLQAVQVVGPYSSSNVSASSAPIISGLYTGLETGTYTINQQGGNFTVTGLENVPLRQIDTRTTYSLGTKGLYIQFPTDQVSATWEVKIPNDQAAIYVTNYNAYQAANAAQVSALTTAQGQVDSAKSALASAEANLAQLKSSATSAEIGAARASILSAEGQVASAQATFNNTILKAPAAGTITSVDVKVGEQAVSLKEVMILQDVNNLYAEANVSEANIASLRTGQDVDYTFDALGPDRHFKGKITSINPASTVISGVVNYKVEANFENVTDVKPGMTANMTVMVAQKPGVLAVPITAIFKHDNKTFVRVIDDPVKKTYHEVEVVAGLQGDSGMVEIVSGLSEGQSVVTFMK
jgi:HlyD family secretion protein